MQKVERWMNQSDEINDRVLAALDVLPLDAVREIAKLYVDITGYLGEHMPQEREDVAPFACSGKTYHYCSFTTEHDPGCPAAGGDGKLRGPHKDGGRPCAADCGETDAKPWCHCSGFDCPDCEMVDNLLGILAAAGVPA